MSVQNFNMYVHTVKAQSSVIVLNYLDAIHSAAAKLRENEKTGIN